MRYSLDATVGAVERRMSMKFETGKCYQHTTGAKVRMLCEIDTYFYGHCILGETDNGEYVPCGMSEENSENYVECEDFAKKEQEGE